MTKVFAKQRAEHVRIIVSPIGYALRLSKYPTAPVRQIAQLGRISSKHSHEGVGPVIGKRIVGAIITFRNHSKARLSSACGDHRQKIKMPVRDMKQEHPVPRQMRQVAG